MNRRRFVPLHSKLRFFITGFALLFLAAAAAVVSAQVASPSAEKKPNIILVNLDDMRYEAWKNLPQTAKFFKNNGIIFQRAYVTIPLCCPSRASLLTGLYAHNHGIKQNQNSGEYGDGGAEDFTKNGLDQSTLVTWLHSAGYATGLFGKYLNNYWDIAPYIPPGWDDWRAFATDEAYYRYWLAENGQKVWYGDAEKDYSTDVIRDKALAFLETTRNSGKPFFVYFTPTAPHAPATPASRHKGTLGELQVPRKSNFGEVAVNAPFWQKVRSWSDDKTRDSDSLYTKAAETLLSVDEAIQAMIQALRVDGRLKNTVIIVTNDNGYSFGAHRWKFKECLYEECARVPLAVYDPLLIASPRLDNSHVISNIDITATIIDRAGVVPPAKIDGKSLVSIFNNPNEPFRDAVLIERWGLGGQDDCTTNPLYTDRQGTGGEIGSTCTVPTFRAVRSQDDWKYAELLSGETELYDLKNDPDEMNNLAGKPEYKPVVERLKAILDRMVNE